MAVRWSIAFKTLSGHDGLVKVYDSNYSGDPIAVEPAVNAFSTTCQEQDLFQPVITDSGYLRVIDNGIAAQYVEDIHPLGALDRPVEYYQDNVLKWRGYISPESFSMNWEPAPRVVEFPLVGVLNVLESVTVQDNGTGLQPIAAFIKEILTATGFSWDNVILAQQMASIDTYEDFPEFRLSLSRYNFVRYNTTQNIDDPDWTKYVGDTYLECLQKICLYFGWTASQKGADFVLTNSRLDLTDAGSNKISWNDLAALAADPLDTVTPVAVERPQISLSSLDFDGIGHRKSIRNGFKKVTVQAPVASSSNIFPEILFNGRQVAFYTHEQIYYRNSLKVKGLVKFLDINRENVTLYSYHWDSGRSVWVRENWSAPTEEPFEINPRADIVQGCTLYGSALFPYRDKENYTPYLRLCRQQLIDSGSGSGSGSGGDDWEILPGNKPLAIIRAGEASFFAGGGALCFSAKARKNFSFEEQPTDPDDPYIYYYDKDGLTQAIAGRPAPGGGPLVISVQIGDLYYDGSDWVDYPMSFEVPMSGSGSQGYDMVTDNNAGRYDGAMGYMIPIPEDMYGQIVITFYPWVRTLYQTEIYTNTLFLFDLSLRYFNNAVTESTEFRGVRIGQLTGKAFKSDESVDLSAASLSDKQPPISSNQYLFYDGNIIGTEDIFTYCDEDDTVLSQPEYWLMDSYVKAYTNPATWLELEVSYDEDIQLYSVITYEGKKYLVTGIDTAYEDEHIKLWIASYE